MENADSAEQTLAKLEEILNEYEKQQKLVIKVDGHIEEYLSYSAEDFSRLSSEHCGEIAASLALYSIQLQKEQNRQSTVVRWCEAIIERTNGKSLNQSKSDKYTKFEEAKLVAMLNNTYTSKLNDLKIKASTRLNTIYGMSSKIDLYIKTLLELQQSKRRYKT